MRRIMAILMVVVSLAFVSQAAAAAGRQQQVGYYVGAWVARQTGSYALASGFGAVAGWGARTAVSWGARRVGSYIGGAVGSAIGGPVGTAVGFFVGGV